VILAEPEYLAVFDSGRQELAHVADMPDSRLDLFIQLCLQGQGGYLTTRGAGSTS
jgi:hypothetical protein